MPWIPVVGVLCALGGLAFLVYMIRSYGQTQAEWRQREADHAEYQRLSTEIVQLNQQFRTKYADRTAEERDRLWLPIVTLVVDSIMKKRDRLATLRESVSLARALVNDNPPVEESGS